MLFLTSLLFFWKIYYKDEKGSEAFFMAVFGEFEEKMEGEVFVFIGEKTKDQSKPNVVCRLATKNICACIYIYICTHISKGTH